MTLNFILCPSFHGATLLSLLLNNHGEISCLGDTLPRRTYDQLCSCRTRVSSCGFWREVGARIGADRFVDSDYLLPPFPRVFRSQLLNRVAGVGLRGIEGSSRVPPLPLLNNLLGVRLANHWIRRLRWSRLLPAEPLREYASAHVAFGEVVRQIHGTHVFVDGSKSLCKVVMLRDHLGPGARIRIIHLFRDPRAFVASWRKNEGSGSVGLITGIWRQMHGRFCLLRDLGEDVEYLRVRYEDLCTDPHAIMKQVHQFLGVADQDVIGPPKRAEKHHLMGNQMLFRFDGTVRHDDSWMRALPKGEMERIVALTYPLSAECGYV